MVHPQESNFPMAITCLNILKRLNDCPSLHHHFQRALAICFVLLVRQLTTACEAPHQTSVKQPKASVKQAKASVKHIQSIWQTSTEHLTDVCQTFDFLRPKHLSNIYKAFDRQVESI